MNPTLLLVNTVITAGLYFLAGMIRDGISVWYYRSISRQWDLSASGLAGGIELYDFFVLATIARSGWNPMLIFAYATGTACGTYLAMRMGRKK